MGFPVTRPRRLRGSPVLRDLVRECRLTADDLIMPLFVAEGIDAPQPIGSMPGQFRWPAGLLADECARLAALGVRAVILFGIPRDKDETGSGAWDEAGIVPLALRQIRARCPDLYLIGDVCLCEYTSHGHCGLTGPAGVENDATLELLARTAVCQARAGADMVAPSDMMDGRVAAIRAALDAAGFSGIPIMSYAAKYASAWYGPFREAAGSAPAFGDRRGYQMDPGNGREALREVALDVAEGADIVMVKPGLCYLDIVRRVREAVELPVAVYNVSGEYAMVKAAAERGWIDERRIVLETLLSMKRAGADLILTYHAGDAAGWLGGGG